MNYLFYDNCLKQQSVVWARKNSMQGLYMQEGSRAYIFSQEKDWLIVIKPLTWLRGRILSLFLFIYFFCFPLIFISCLFL